MATRRVVLATSNAGKLREMQALLATSGFEVCSQDQFGVISAAETGLSFIENAILKARHAARVTGWPALADDSGLVVEALNGRPGIYSARYAGADADDQRNQNRLLADLAGVPAERRAATFVCVLAWLRDAHDPAPRVCEGHWHGRIAAAPRGTNGFGYDPVFWLDEHHCTAAELTPAEKTAASHRGQALRALLAPFVELN